MLFLSEIPDACLALGLTRDPGLAFRATGKLDGARVVVQQVGNGSNENDLALFAWLPHPLDLGWRVVQGGTHGYHGDAVRTGATDFDGVIDVACDAPALAHPLLDEEVRDALLRMVRVGRPVVTDEVAGFFTTAFGLKGDELAARLRWCVALAHALDRRGSRLPAQAALQAGDVAARFAADAAARGLSVRHNALCAEGALSTLWLRATARSRGSADVTALQAVLTPTAPGTRVFARFHEPLGAGLSLRPAGLADRVKDLVGLGDLRLDDPEFDRAWTVTAADPDAARALLHEGARAHLTRLAATGLRFSLDDRGVQGHGPLPASPETLPHTLWLLDALRDTLRTRPQRAAYR